MSRPGRTDAAPMRTAVSQPRMSHADMTMATQSVQEIHVDGRFIARE
jgi:hypothetical protein